MTTVVPVFLTSERQATSRLSAASRIFESLCAPEISCRADRWCLCYSTRYVSGSTRVPQRPGSKHERVKGPIPTRHCVTECRRRSRQTLFKESYLPAENARRKRPWFGPSSFRPLLIGQSQHPLRGKLLLGIRKRSIRTCSLIDSPFLYDSLSQFTSSSATEEHASLQDCR